MYVCLIDITNYIWALCASILKTVLSSSQIWEKHIKETHTDLQKGWSMYWRHSKQLPFTNHIISVTLYCLQKPQRRHLVVQLIGEEVCGGSGRCLFLINTSGPPNPLNENSWKTNSQSTISFQLYFFFLSPGSMYWYQDALLTVTNTRLMVSFNTHIR